MDELTSRQRRFLMKKAHDLDPVVTVGRKGVTPPLVSMLDEALEHHELVKLRFQVFKEDKREIAVDLAGASRSTLVAVLGNRAVFYRQARDPGRAVAELPAL